jgi:3-carboxy-cis,cis-muconate cycloisomerase
VAGLLATMPHEHERALGGWQAELAEWSQLLVSVHASSKAMASALPYLVVDSDRMRSHIEAAARSVDKESAKTWFSPALALGAGQLARSYLSALRADFPAPVTAQKFILKTGT